MVQSRNEWNRRLLEVLEKRKRDDIRQIHQFSVEGKKIAADYQRRLRGYRCNLTAEGAM